MIDPASRPVSARADGRPWTAAVVSALVALEAVALLGAALMLFASLFSGHVLPVAGILFGSVVLAGGAVWLAGAARGTWAGRRWPRAAVLVSQAFLLIVGLSFLQVALGPWGIAVAVVAVVTILCLFAPPTVAWMHRTRDDTAR